LGGGGESFLIFSKGDFLRTRGKEEVKKGQFREGKMKAPSWVGRGNSGRLSLGSFRRGEPGKRRKVYSVGGVGGHKWKGNKSIFKRVWLVGGVLRPLLENECTEMMFLEYIDMGTGQ